MQDIQLAVDLLGWVEAAFLVVGLVLGLFGTLLFGHGYKHRIADLEQRAAVPAIHQTFNVSAGADARGIRDAMEAETARGLRETMRQLPQRPLGDAHRHQGGHRGRTVARQPRRGQAGGETDSTGFGPGRGARDMGRLPQHAAPHG
ncbi:MAG: hypothetical protein OXH59_13845, partial [Rhodospirillaceae bacterium]|nr:hypothetical protein [Rhodospirillaceae bacterium]